MYFFRGLWRRQVVLVVANLRFAIGLLLVIAACSVIGTVIEQDKSIKFYIENYPESPALFGFITYKFIYWTGIDHVYRTWWFLGLLVLFGLSLATCTMHRQVPLLRAARRWFFYNKPQSIAKLPFSVTLPAQHFGEIIAVLQKKGYRVSQTDHQLYASKGLGGRIGPIIVHGSMLVILLGAIGGALGGFTAQEMVPSGETFQIENVTAVGPFGKQLVPKDWSVRVNRFWIDYTPKGNIDQFYSDLSILDREGEEVDRETIFVNKPLRYRGVTLYQASWDIDGIKFSVNRSPDLRLPMSKLKASGQDVWGTWIPTKPDLSAGVSLVTPDLQGTILIYDTQGKLLQTTRTGQSVQVNGVTLNLKELIGATGLQIKADPGIPIVYAGFGLLMLGVIMSYISYSQVWVLQEGDTLYFGGKTNRAQVAFFTEMTEVLSFTSKAG